MSTEIMSDDSQPLNLSVIDVNGRILVTIPAQLQKGLNLIDNKIPTLVTGIYYIKLIAGDQFVTKTVVSDH